MVTARSFRRGRTTTWCCIPHFDQQPPVSVALGFQRTMQDSTNREMILSRPLVGKSIPQKRRDVQSSLSRPDLPDSGPTSARPAHAAPRVPAQQPRHPSALRILYRTWKMRIGPPYRIASRNRPAFSFHYPFQPGSFDGHPSLYSPARSVRGFARSFPRPITGPPPLAALHY